METNYKSFRRGIAQANYQHQENNVLLTYDQAIEEVRTSLGEKLSSEIDLRGKREKEIKDKAYLRKQKGVYKNYITDIVFGRGLRIRGYDENNISEFINDMVEEFAGFSVLADAMDDEDITDIFAIDWETIFVEKKGVNVKYTKTFRSKLDFQNFIERLLREDNKEINNGDSKIVDFEVYGDRGCATSPGVSPRDYSLTLRKHKEDHITKDQLVVWKCFSEEMAEFLGTTIMGECNIIYAGLTGSGKTTTIRALLDHFVTLANKRMLVCEDTQELFPKNEHTLELVSVKSDDPKQAVPLSQLVKTALRLKPKYIVVGEVREIEAQAAVEAMETGHSTIFTMHAGKAINAINRLVTKYLVAMPSLGIDVVERIIGEAVDYICIQDDIPGIGRKLTSISEVSYNYDTRRIDLRLICKFDFDTQDFAFVYGISQDKADKMLRRGISKKELEKWTTIASTESDHFLNSAS